MSSKEPQSGHPPVMHNLVVCGADDGKADSDAACFSDFMGISSTLRLVEPDIGGTFLSCFPVKEHFDTLSKKSPQINDIKWGKWGPEGKPVFIWSKAKFEKKHKRPWYSYCRPADIYNEVVSWIWTKAQTTKSGDVVTMYFQCHGNHAGICLGSRTLKNEEVASLLGRFPEGVQVNAIGSQCYSGRLVTAVEKQGQKNGYVVTAAGANEPHFTATRSVSNRFRNFRFSEPFIKSIGTLRFASESNAAPVTIAEHDAAMEKAMSADTPSSPAKLASTYNSYLATNKAAAVQELEDILLREYADLGFQSKTIAHQDRMEQPSLAGTVKAIFSASSTNAPSAAKDAAQALVMAAASECDKDFPEIHDMNILGRLYHVQQPDYDVAMRTLYWRNLQMSAVWNLFLFLADRGFLSFDSLIQPISFRRSSPEIGSVMLILMCFEYAWPDSRADIFHEDFHWDAGITWLAVTIVRSGIKLAHVVDAIARTGALGRLNETELIRRIKEEGFSNDPTSQIGSEPPSFGFWLPSGLGNDPGQWSRKVQEAVDRSKQIEATFMDYFQIPNDLLPRGQSETLFDNPLFAANTTERRFRQIKDL